MSTKRARRASKHRHLEPVTYQGHPRATASGRVTDLDGISTVEYPMGLSARDALDLVLVSQLHLSMARLEVLGSVAACRDAGVTWDGIAAAMGEPKSTVITRYGHILDQGQEVAVSVALPAASAGSLAAAAG